METNLKRRPSAEKLRQQLSSLRMDSLAASRRGDFRTVARLTLATAQINRLLTETAEWS